MAAPAIAPRKGAATPPTACAVCKFCWRAAFASYCCLRCAAPANGSRQVKHAAVLYGERLLQKMQLTTIHVWQRRHFWLPHALSVRHCGHGIACAAACALTAEPQKPQVTMFGWWGAPHLWQLDTLPG
jgi:hypothetical protein